jgi:hypothetical protein
LLHDFCYSIRHSDAVRQGVCIVRLSGNFRASIVAIFAAAVSVALGGCWMAAAQFAPIAANIGEQVGGDALELTAGVEASTHAQQNADKKEEDARQSAMTSGDTCNQLEVEVPDVIELRRGAAGAPEYRELEIGDSLDQRQWLPLADSETTPDGWRPAVNFLQMDFSPPLGAVVPETASTYLAYTPSKVITAADGDRLTAMSTNFGPPVGTFTWKGTYYHYVVTSTLPCFPPPPERLAQDVRARSGF